MPSQVYRLDPTTRSVRVVAADFDKPNGIAFSPDGKLAYVWVYFLCFISKSRLTRA